MHSFSFTDLVNLNIYYVPGTFDSPRLNKNPLNGWGKGKNIQVNPCFDANSASRNSISTVYKGQSSRSKGHRAGVTLQIKWRDLWNLITDKVHLLFYPYHIYDKDLYLGQSGWWGCQSLKFPNRHFRLDSYQFHYITFDHYSLTVVFFFFRFQVYV